MRVGEARARLGLELVAGEVLRPERERLVEIAVEVGGALARDPVDEIERDVVEAGIAENVDGAADVVGLRAPLEHGEQGGWKLCAPSDTRLTRFRDRSRASPGVTVSGFASTVTSSASGSPASSRSSAAGSVKVGVPPPRKIVSSRGASAPRSSASSASSASTYASCWSSRPTAVTKSQ